MRSWIYQKSKAELRQIAEELQLDATGGIDVLRRLLSRFFQSHPEEMDAYKSPATTATATATATAPATAPAVPNIDTASILSQMRKWGCVFDGRDPVSFLERIEELRQGYGYPGEYLLRGLPELLRGDTLLWYRNQRDVWQSWMDFENDFRQQFLPPQYQLKLRREIENRLHKQGESYLKYETDMLTMMRRAGGIPSNEQLHRLYENLDPDYKMYVRWDDLQSRADLRDRALQFEAIREQQKNRRTIEPTKTGGLSHRPALAAATYNRDECCWRCKQRGHNRRQCRRPARIFCSQCGKDGVLTRTCHPQPGNSARVEENGASP